MTTLTDALGDERSGAENEFDTLGTDICLTISLADRGFSVPVSGHILRAFECVRFKPASTESTRWI
jgi:hypothetical protein